jgi:hypothetical protein
MRRLLKSCAARSARRARRFSPRFWLGLRALLRSLLLAIFVGTVGEGTAAPPPEGSQLPPDENACAMCHGEAGLWEKDTLRLYMPAEKFADDVHWQKGVNCHDCHGGDPSVFDPGDLHAKEDGFRDLADVKKACAICHKDQAIDLVRGIHARAGEPNERGRGTPLECGKCHGENQHRILPVKDPRSPVFLDHQVNTCGSCHEEHLKTYRESVHGVPPRNAEPPEQAVCADCHGAHGVYLAADERSTLYATKVADTCGKCHPTVEERLKKSVHGRGQELGGLAERTAPGGTGRREPSCTDCHQGHDFPRPELARFQLELPNRCGNCHAALSTSYAMSLHGELTRLGYVPAAQCSDCHGSHDVLRVSDPRSRLAPGNRLGTCSACHRHAVKNFTDFDPHANYLDAANYPFLHFAYSGLRSLFFFFFGFFIVHAFFWFLRSFIRTFQQGRHKTLVTEQFALVRSEPVNRLLYVILIVSFLGLTLTSLPLKYSSRPWAHSLAARLGGFESSSLWHRLFAVGAILSCLAHLAWGGRRIVQLRRRNLAWKTILFGPDSPVPNLRDAKDLWGMVRWFLGAGPRPVFERWTYWEKFDYWALYLAAGVIGISGLMLWLPNLFSRVLPGEALNVAKVIHSQVAFLAASFLFIFHFFHSHFRPEKFPMDLSVLTGLVSEEHLRKYRPEYVERIEREGRLDQVRRKAPSRGLLRLVMLGGFVVLLAGCGLLIAVLLAGLES